jgi:hypothetical protein
MIVPIIVISIVLAFNLIRAKFRNEDYVRTHEQVCQLSDSIDKKYYQCELPQNGTISVILKKGKDGKATSTKEITGKTFLEMKPHQGHYPPNSWKYLQAPISEYYVGDSFVPISLGKTDPLEVASALFRLEHENVISKIVHESHIDAEKEKKKEQSPNTKSILQLVLMAGVLNIVVSGIGIYLIMKGNVSIADILNGLRSLGVIH